VEYEKIFDPGAVHRGELPGQTAAAGDLRDGSVYVYDDAIVLAVNVALVTGRPLLVAGPPGSGKSSLALNVALKLGWEYIEEVISSRTQARDLLWHFDVVGRLRDAQAGDDVKDPGRYIQRGVLWKAFTFATEGRRAVVLLDEIDKADPDVPNNLLVALGSLAFTVEETGEQVVARADSAPLVVITTNDERELSKPFLRRCIVLSLPPPNSPRLVEIARAHDLGGSVELYAELAQLVGRLRGEAVQRGLPPPSTAEFLDTVRACIALRIAPSPDGDDRPGSDEWELLKKTTLLKRVEPLDMPR
jgi:MoxR-like ATPase